MQKGIGPPVTMGQERFGATAVTLVLLFDGVMKLAFCQVFFNQKLQTGKRHIVAHITRRSEQWPPGNGP